MKRFLGAALLAAIVAAAAPLHASASGSPPAGPTFSTAHVAMENDYMSAVNPVTGDVYAGDNTGNQVVVRNAGGAAVGTIAVADPQGVTTSADGQTIWVASTSTNQVLSYDATTLALTHTYDLSAMAGCPLDLVVLASGAWVSYSCGGASDQGSGLVRIQPSTHTVTEFPVISIAGGGGIMLVSPDASTLIGVGSNGDVWKVDISTPSDPTISAHLSTLDDGCFEPTRAAYLQATHTVAIVCAANNQSSPDLFSVDISDLSAATTYDTSGLPLLMGVTSDQAGHLYLIGDAYDDSSPVVYVYNAGNATPVEQYLRDPTYTTAPQGGLAVTADGTDLYTFSYDILHANTGFQLLVIGRPTVPRGIVLAAATQSSVIKGQQVTVSGSLLQSDDAPPSGTSLTVTRANQDGTHTALADVIVAGDGSFQFSDVPTQAGAAEYEIGYAGDATHAAGSAEVSVAVTLPVPTLTLTRSAKQVTYGSSVTLTAQLSAHGSNGDITLNDNGAPVATATMNASGIATFVVKPAADASYQAVYAGDETEAPKTSSIVSVAVAWRVTQKMLGAYRTKHGYHLYHYSRRCGGRRHRHCPVFSAAVAPGAGGMPADIQFQARSGRHWLNLLDKGVHLTSNGTFQLKLTYRTRTIIGVPLRARLGLLPATNKIAAVRPPWVYFKVTT